MSAHKTLTINIDKVPTWERLEVVAKERKTSPRTIINWAIEEWLNRNDR